MRVYFHSLAVIASETREMSRNSKNIWHYSSSRSSKGHRSCCQWKAHMWLPISHYSCNFGRICYRFRDIDA